MKLKNLAILAFFFASFSSCGNQEVSSSTPAASSSCATNQGSRFTGAWYVYEAGVREGYGSAGQANPQRGNDCQTRFFLGSISKTLTAVAVLSLAEQGKLKLSDRVTQHLPDSGAQGVSIQNLLNHTSGAKTNIENDRDFNQVRSSAELYQMLKNKGNLPSLRPSNFSYNSLNYILLGVIIEKVTRQSLSQAFNQLIFSPAGMPHSGFYYDANTNSSDFADDLKFNGARTSGIFASTAGGMYSTLNDMFAFDSALKNGTLISKSAVTEMMSGRPYGYGFFADQQFGGLPYHQGVIDGYKALYISSKPGEKYFLYIALSNDFQGRATELFR